MPKRTDINLIPSELRQQKKTEEIRKSFNFAGLGIFVFLAIISALVLSYRLKLKVDLDSYDKSITREQEKIKDLSSVEQDGNRLKVKSEAATKILKNRSLFSILLDTLSESVPQQVTITNFSTVGENKLGVTGSAQSYISLANFILTALDPSFGGKTFNGADLTSVSLDETTGRAKFSLVLYLKSNSLTREK